MKAGVDYTGVTVSFFCQDGEGNFVLHKRSQNCRDEQGHWDFGGGKLEFGESFEEGLLREIKEEYGCDAEILEQLPPLAINRMNGGVPTHWVSVAFIMKVDPKEVRIGEPESMDEIGWFRMDALPEPLHSTFSPRMKTQAKFFEKYI